MAPSARTGPAAITRTVIPLKPQARIPAPEIPLHRAKGHISPRRLPDF
jgi:hypothetical protein